MHRGRVFSISIFATKAQAASTVHPPPSPPQKKISRISGIPKKILANLAYPQNIPILYVDLKKWLGYSVTSTTSLK